MLRRDFLKAVAAFTAASAAPAAAVASLPKAAGALPQSPAVGLLPSWPGDLDIAMIRHDDFSVVIKFDDFAARLREPVALIYGLDGRNMVARRSRCAVEGDWCRISFPSSITGLLRPGVRKWMLYDGERMILTGNARVLPDVRWRSQDEILSHLPKLKIMGIEPKQFSRGDVIAYFRERLPGEPESQFSLPADHWRPKACRIFNGGAGCQVRFAREELL
jgi:hypothetical protein